MNAIPDAWLGSFEAMVVALTMSTVLIVNGLMVVWIGCRRGARSLLDSYVRRRERRFTAPVFSALIDPPARVSSRLPHKWMMAPATLASRDVLHRLRLGRRPGDSVIVEHMFLRMAVELRGADRATITGICEDAGFVDRYERRLRSRRWWVRLAAARRLGIMRSTQSTSALSAALYDPNREVSLAALRALGEIGDPRCFDRLLAAMEDETRWDSVLIAEVVLTLGAPVAQSILNLTLAARDTELRAGYTRLLGLLHMPAAVSVLTPFLQAAPETLRLETVRALGSIGDSRVVGRLLPLLQDSSAPIRAATAVALGRIGDEEAVAYLLPLLADADRSVRVSSATALAAAGKSGLLALTAVANDTDPVVRLLSRQVLAEVDLGLR